MNALERKQSENGPGFWLALGLLAGGVVAALTGAVLPALVVFGGLGLGIGIVLARRHRGRN